LGGIVLCLFKDDGDGVFDPAEGTLGDCNPNNLAPQSSQGQGTAVPTAPGGALPTVPQGQPTRPGGGGGTTPTAESAEGSGFDPAIYQPVGRDAPGQQQAPNQQAPTQEIAQTEEPGAAQVTSSPTPSATAGAAQATGSPAAPQATGSPTAPQGTPSGTPGVAQTTGTAPAAQTTPTVVTGDVMIDQPITDKQGGFVLRNLVPGTYFITIGDRLIPLEIRQGIQPYTLSIPIQPGVAIEFQVEIPQEVAAILGTPGTSTPTLNATQQTAAAAAITQTFEATMTIGAGGPLPTEITDTGFFSGDKGEVTPTDLMILMLAGGVLLGVVLTARKMRST